MILNKLLSTTIYSDFWDYNKSKKDIEKEMWNILQYASFFIQSICWKQL